MLLIENYQNSPCLSKLQLAKVGAFHQTHCRHSWWDEVFCSINKQSITKAIYAPAVWPLLWILLLQLMKNELFARAQSISVQGSARRSMKAI